VIEVELDNDARTGRFILRPQRSATWRDNLWLVAAVAALAVPIALYWTVFGFWPVLLVCVLHLLALTWALYKVSHALLAREVVTVGPERITIEAGHREVERRFELTRAWAQVRLQSGARRRHNSLILRSAGSAVELGRFLTDDEREQLAGELKRVVTAAPPLADSDEPRVEP
jgi:uncharacterized membrane protein